VTRALRRGSGGELTVLKNIIGIIVAILIVVWIVASPAAAGNDVHTWITGIVTFFRHMA
jgi:hypothetical protein